jgi:hypothetical protein
MLLDIVHLPLLIKEHSHVYNEIRRFGDWILKTETKFGLRNVVFCKINRTMFLYKDRTMDNVQKYNIFTNGYYRAVP